MHTLAIFGGTFDPIHNGHIQVSLSIQSLFKFGSFLFLPCKIPALKALPLSSQAQRIAMLQLAINDYPQFKLDLREIKRNTPSYMIETLKCFRTEYPKASITLILGYDAFLSLPQWHEWEKIINLANFLVIDRAQKMNGPSKLLSNSGSESLNQLLIKHQTKMRTEILEHKAGLIYLFNAGNYDISSTEIREGIKNHQVMEKELPSQVLNYIKSSSLYRY